MISNTDHPVIFIHGLLGGSRMYSGIQEAFEARSVSVPDLLGYGLLQDVPPESLTLAAQVEHVRRVILDTWGNQRVHVVGHSVGGVIAYLFAHQYSQLVASVVSLEGNFTLKDAFWSASIAKMTVGETETMLESFREDPATWLAKSGIPDIPLHIETANVCLSQQPGATVHAMAKSVVEVTSSQEYLPSLQHLFKSIPVHLVAGERSREGWDVPHWALESAVSMTVMSHVGHLMMFEDAPRFGRVIVQLL